MIADFQDSTGLRMTALGAENSLHESIDSQLGDARDRYFGTGFSKVEHTVAPLTCSNDRGSFEVATHYPSDWSKKDQKLQTAHLSSIDALVITARMVEAHLQEQGFAERAPGAWLSHCELRPGRTPVDVSESLTAHLDASLTRETHEHIVMNAQAQIGDFKVVVALQLSPPHESLERAPAQQGLHYFTEGYRTIPRWLGPVTSLTSPQAECPIQIGDESSRQFSGLESAHGSAVSFVDAILVAAQIGQVLLYDLDGVRRGETETMWLRRATFSRSRPPSGSSWNGRALVTPIRTQLLERAEHRWRTIDLRAHIADIEVNYSLTHQLHNPTPRDGEYG